MSRTLKVSVGATMEIAVEWGTWLAKNFKDGEEIVIQSDNPDVFRVYRKSTEEKLNG